ncbi:MAG: protein kinase [Myxococcota bacterium]
MEGSGEELPSAPTVVQLPDEEPPRLESQLALERARARLLGASAQPTEIGRYTILEKLGAGGMGVVYSAHDPDLDRTVAVKVLRSRMVPDSQGRTRLLREAQALAKLSHPNVVHVYEVGRADGQVFIAMEFVQGRTLTAWVREEQPSIADALARYVDAGEGLLAAHSAGVVHRDFKPDNVLVGDDGRVRVMDFGLARASMDADTLTDLAVPEGDLDPTITPPSMTKTGTIMGTPAYMDPQQLMGTTADERSDQYAFCVSLYESLTGERPFRGSTVTQLFAAMNRSKPDALGFGGKAVPKAVQALIRRGLAYAREDRFPSFEALLEALRSASTQPQPSWRRWLLPVAGAAAIAVAGVAMQREPEVTTTDPSTAAPVDPWTAVVEATDLPTPLDTPLADDPVGATVHRLRNGLTVYVVPRPEEPLVRLQVVVRAGPSEEPDTARGVAQWMTEIVQEGSLQVGVQDPEAEAPFLAAQHEALLAASETEDRAALLQKAHDAHRDSIGTLAQGDAKHLSKSFSIGEDIRYVDVGTSFDSVLPSSALDGWLQFQAESLQRPAFRGGVITLAHTIDDLGWQHASSTHYLAMMNRIASVYGQGRDPATEHASLQSVPFEALRQFHETYYRPNNIALVVMGDVTPDSVLPSVEKAFGDWEPGPIPAPAALEDRPAENASFTVTAPAAASIWVGWALPPAARGTRARTEALASLLSGPHGLFEGALADSDILTDPWVMLDGRALVLGGTPKGDASAEDVQAAIVAALTAVANGSTSDDAWARASVSWPLDAASWDRSRPELMDRIGRAYLEHRPWADVVAGHTGAPVRRDALEASAQAVLARPRFTMTVEPGPPWSPEGPPLPVEAAWPTQEVTPPPSRWARTLAELPRAPVEPRFLSDGMHFRRTAWGDATVITHDARGPLFWADIVYPVGVAHDPFVCDATRMRAQAWLDAGALAQLKVESWCTADSTTIAISGVADAFEPMWAELWTRLNETTLDPTLVTEEVSSMLRARADGRSVPYRLKVAGSTYAWHGQRGLQHHMPDDATLRATTAARFEQSLATLSSVTPDIAYAGPNAKALRSNLPDAFGPRPAPLPEVSAPSEHTIYVVDTPELEQAEARLMAKWLHDTPADTLAADLYNLQPGPGFDPLSQRGVVAFAPTSRSTSGMLRSGFTWGYGAPHEDIAGILGEALDAYAQGPSPSRYAAARARMETNARHHRYTRIEIPRFVQMWEDAIDPRLERWTELARMTPEAFADYVARQGAVPLSMVLFCDLKKTDMAALDALARVVVVPREDLVRNVADRHASAM